jgi:hypothetical protein
MNRLTKALYKWQLPKLISKMCESRIPRSGEEGAKVNCYVLAINKESNPYFLVNDIEGDQLVGLEWDGNHYSIQKKIPISSINDHNFFIEHYYGLSEVTYSGIYDFIITKITNWPYLNIRVHRWIESIDQYFFNRKKLITKQRIDLLRFMMSDQIDRVHKGISSLDLMTKLYSIKWVLHPEGDQQQEKLELYLDSLVKSEDLKLINNEYVVTGNAIRTIEKFEEEERRHVKSVKIQWIIFWLTFLIAIISIILAAIQAGLIKLPALLNLNEKPKVESAMHNK